MKAKNDTVYQMAEHRFHVLVLSSHFHYVPASFLFLGGDDHCGSEGDAARFFT
jgi:hypothetical protein